MRLTILVAAIVCTCCTVAAAETTNLYDWLGIAPVVVTAKNLGTYGKYAEFHVEAYLRGDGQAGDRIRVAVRRANRDRDRRLDKEALRFDAGRAYVLLLAPAARRGGGHLRTYELVRGVQGARETPLEGEAAFLAAVERFLALQQRNDDRHTWRQLAEMLEDTNPVLLGTALDQHLKFERGDASLLETLRPLLDHPDGTVRRRAALVIAGVIERTGDDALPDRATLESELIARARRDTAPEVRVAATRALGRLPGAAVDAILEEISREDPDQAVRYVAERLVHERLRDAGEGASLAGGHGAP